MMKRPRLECPYCKEILSYSYCRHVETKVCIKKLESICAEAGLNDHEHDELTQETLEFSVTDSHCSDFDSHELTGISEQEVNQYNLVPATGSYNSLLIYWFLRR